MVMGEHEITQLLKAASAGNEKAWDELFSAVYSQLRRLASSKRANWRNDDTLGDTALVHEVYLRMSQRRRQWRSRAHFFNAASKAIRHILVDHARKRSAAKRGGDTVRVPLDSIPLLDDVEASEILELNEALERLGLLHERQSRVVECRFFGGLGIEETAEALGVSARTVKRDWNSARVWLYRDLTRKATATPPPETPETPEPR